MYCVFLNYLCVLTSWGYLV